jgi:hypothetical protein
MSYQACLTREVAGGGEHTLDLHWKISNSELLSRLFSYDELREAAVPLPALSPHAFGAGLVHALLIACMHRAGHKQAPYFVDGVAHYSGDRLIWLYDIHLLAQAMSPAQWDEFLRLAGQKGLRAVCLEGIEQTRSRFATPVPQEVLDELARPGSLEPAAQYLDARHLKRRWLDLCAHQGLAGKLRFISRTGVSAGGLHARALSPCPAELAALAIYIAWPRRTAPARRASSLALLLLIGARSPSDHLSTITIDDGVALPQPAPTEGHPIHGLGHLDDQEAAFSVVCSCYSHFFCLCAALWRLY